jgi:alkylation response protein AidB-like acyl-CoA dehydrogenase
MDLDFSVEQYALRDEARRFLEAQSPPSHVREFLDDKAGWSRDLWKQMADLGWMALPFDEQFGGLGQGFLDLVLLLGELGRVLAPVPFLSSIAMAGQVIAAHGSEEQKARWLPAIASGERIATVCFVDGSAWGTVSAEVERGTLTCEKRVVFDAPAADLFVVAARDGERARWFVAESSSELRAQTTYDPTRKLGTVRFDGAAAEPLERPGLEPGLNFAVAALCAEAIGAAEKVLDMTVAYSKERVQFGRPIGSFQAIKHKCAEMATGLEASRAAAYYACWAVSSAAPDAAVAVSIAKSYCSEVLAHIGDEGVQIHGGIAFTWEHDMHLYLKRLKSFQAAFGDEAFHRERIAQLTGL